jgi:hypothetical protein
MERKHFLVAAGAIGAVVTAAGVASGAGNPFPGSSPYPAPSGSPGLTPGLRHHGVNRSFSDIEHASRVVTHVIKRLSRDQADYGGHRVAAISDLERAQAELAAAIQYEHDHPSSSPLGPSYPNPSIPGTNQLNSGQN